MYVIDEICDSTTLRLCDNKRDFAMNAMINVIDDICDSTALINQGLSSKRQEPIVMPMKYRIMIIAQSQQEKSLL